MADPYKIPAGGFYPEPEEEDENDDDWDDDLDEEAS